MKRYALLSVFDKTGIVDFAKVLQSLDYIIISTGGTAKVLAENKIPVIPIQEITGNQESFDGRMKTISFQVESGILYDRQNPTHVKQAKNLGIKPIDIVVCNLYPFEQTIQKPQVALDEAVENIDVGGPTMIRSAAKNFKNVLVVIDPNDYKEVINFLYSCNRFYPSSESRTKLRESREVSEQNSSRPARTIQEANFRKQLAAKAFGHLSFYDSQIAHYLTEELFPQKVTIPGRKLFDLRYGENPHQQAALYSQPNTNSSFKNLQKLWGRELSLTNVLDINAGIESVKLFDEPAAVVIKHNSPCGIALGKSAKEALERAISADPESAFGGVIVINRNIDAQTAQVIVSFKDERKGNIDIIAVPSIDADALEFLKSVRKSMGIYRLGKLETRNSKLEKNIKYISGGFVMQTIDSGTEESFKDWKVVTKKKPTKKQLEQMQIAWKFIARIKSNSILVVDKSLPMTRGIGSGQTSRIRSTKIALEQAGKHAKGAILASDSFFPFDDSVKLAIKHGIAAIVQQGGSINDKASIDAANKAGIPMVFTNRRAFWH